MEELKEIDLSQIEGFEWDEGNLSKNSLKHDVDTGECEEVFYNSPQVITYDATHSQHEERYSILGRTTSGRQLTTIFTVRGNKIRVISARPQSKEEREIYAEELKKP